MKTKPVLVTWVDATSDDAWDDIERHSAKEPSKIKTLGFLLKETKDYVIVSLNIDTDNDQASQSITIPKKWCCEIRRLRVKV